MKLRTQNIRFLLFALLLSAICCLPTSSHAQSTNLVLSLNGTTSYVSIPSAADLQSPTEITVEAWIYPVDNGQEAYFVCKSDAGFVNSSRSYELCWQSGSALFNVFLGTSTWGEVGATAPAGQWVHIAGTYSSAESSLKIYKNGVLASSTTNDASGVVPLNNQLLRQTSLPLVFGAELTHPLGFAEGEMDEVRVWSKARTQAEIAGSIACPLLGTEPALEGYWNFDGGVANDVTGNGNNGSLGGGASIVPMVGPDVVHAGCSGPQGATAVPQVVNGFVVGATITEAGSGYTNPPTVTILGGSGTGATAVASVSNGVVVGVTITSTGSGYTNAPVVVIAPPFVPRPGVAAAGINYGPLVPTVVQMNFSDLVPYYNYQLQFSFVLGGSWSDYGLPFASTNTVYTLFVSASGASGFFRLTQTNSALAAMTDLPAGSSKFGDTRPTNVARLDRVVTPR